ncbi:MAG: cupin domain-containing protein [bacterium]|nr:cupin domain-containing protein [bacterium]
MPADRSDVESIPGDPANALAGSGVASRVQALIDRLELVPHPEGGWYREFWRSPIELASGALPPGYPAKRALMTSIYYLLPTGGGSALHRVRSEELWMHHQGDDLALGVGVTPAEAADPGRAIRLGQGEAAALQAIVPAGEWQRAEALAGPAGYALVGCVVAPGFDFDDFEMAD